MAGKSVVTEAHVRDAQRAGQRSLVAPAGALITPLARDAARAAGITIEHGAPASVARVEADSRPTPATASSAKKAPPGSVVIGSDHGGFPLKQELIPVLKAAGLHIVDIGTDSPAACDYPDFAYGVARMVADGRAELGIMIDGAGIGSSMVCNKVPGIRAACAYNEFTAWNARAHNNANVLTLGSRTLGIEVVKRIVTTFLETAFEGGRHAKRVDKMTDIETRFSTL